MTKQSMPIISPLTKDTLEEFKTAEKVVLVGYFAADDKESFTNFTSVAEALRARYPFGVVTDPDLTKVEGASFPSVILYKAFDERKSILLNTMDTEAIGKFISTASIPLIGELDPETHPGYVAKGLPLAYIFAETEEERTKLGIALKPVAENHRSAVSFTTVDTEAFGRYAGNLHLQINKWPAFAIQDTKTNKKFPYDQDAEITAELIEKFVQDFVDGRIEPTVKSEPIPKEQQGPVLIVVGKSFSNIVLDDSRDVLVNFYAPWCFHSQALSPEYDILAGLYNTKGAKVIIAKVDATANDLSEQIEFFPTIKLYKAGDKSNPITYSGNRSIDDLVNFIETGGNRTSITPTKENAGDQKSEGKQAKPATQSGVHEAKETATETNRAEELHDEL